MMRTRTRLVFFGILTTIAVGITVVIHISRADRLYQLLAASGSGDKSAVVELIDAGVPVNGRFGGDGDTPLHRAAAAGATSVVEILLAHGANANALNDQNSTPLLFASFNGNTESVGALLRAGADPNIAEYRFGTTPLMEAARKGHLLIVRLLLAHGANLNTMDKSGETAMQKAARLRNDEIVNAMSSK